MSVSATKADGGPSMLIEHFSPVPAMLEAWQANVPYMALTDSKSPSLAFLKSELASLKKQKYRGRYFAEKAQKCPDG